MFENLNWLGDRRAPAARPVHLRRAAAQGDRRRLRMLRGLRADGPQRNPRPQPRDGHRHQARGPAPEDVHPQAPAQRGGRAGRSRKPLEVTTTSDVRRLRRGRRRGMVLRRPRRRRAPRHGDQRGERARRGRDEPAGAPGRAAYGPRGSTASPSRPTPPDGRRLRRPTPDQRRRSGRAARPRLRDEVSGAQAQGLADQRVPADGEAVRDCVSAAAAGESGR